MQINAGYTCPRGLDSKFYQQFRAEAFSASEPALAADP